MATHAQRELILASTSIHRRQILDALGLRHRAVAPDFDEAFADDGPPASTAEKLARGKARSIADRFPEALIIGADQILAIEGRLLRKPTNATEARAQLSRLAGKSHTLTTGLALVCVATKTQLVVHEVSTLRMRPLEPRELDAYVATGEWEGCVGSYRIEAQGMKLFERVEGDFTNVRGLPALKLCAALRELGVPLFP